MRTRMLAAASVLLAACAGSEPQPKLSISPSGSQTATGPVLITASPVELASEVTWSLSGPGTLSNTTGHDVTYRPPVPAVATPATVTATARGQTATVTFTGQTPQQPRSVIAALSGDVNVTYDQFDIPHIFCANQADCYTVQGYIQAQDRLFEMDLFRRTARGQLSTLVGSAGISQDKQFLTFFVTRDGTQLPAALDAALDADTRAKLDAYVAGVNAYIDFLAQHPTLMPGEYAQLPPPAFTPGDIPHWTRQDTLAIARLQQFSLSETIEEEVNYGLFASVYGNPASPLADPGKLNAYIRAKQPVAAYPLAPADPSFLTAATRAGGPAAAAAVPDMTAWLGGMAAVQAQMQELTPIFGDIRKGAGSNNWVVDAAHSATGNAMVANDPHLTLQYPPLGHLAALTASDGSLDLLGWAFPGIPGALIGRGAHVGWGDTVVGYDVTDLYLESLSCTGTPPQCGAVTFNGAPVPLTVKTFPIAVRGAAATSAQVAIVPHHGPIIQIDPAKGTAISMRWTGHEVTNDVRAFLDLSTAKSVGDITAQPGTAFGALKNFTVGAQNFVLADDAGNIGYDPHALVPQRTWTGTAPAGVPLLPWLPLPGDGSAEWGTGNAADNCAGTGTTLPAAACFVPDNLLPHACAGAACAVKPTKGYIATANSDPAGYTDDNNPLGTGVVSGLYPGYLSFDWSDPTAIRYARIAELLKAKTAAGKVSVADMQAIQSDHAILLGKLFHPFLPASIPGSQAAAYAGAKAVWDQWDADGYDCPTGLSSPDPKSAPDSNATHVRDSAGCLLFHTFLKTLLKNVFDDDFAVISKATGQNFGADRGAEIRGILYMLQPTTPAGDTTLCNDVNASGTTTATHSCGEQVVTALVTAALQLTNSLGPPTNWLWGRTHTLTLASPVPLIGAPFSAGPFARPGGIESVDVGDPDGSQSSPLAFTYSHGSNIRYISVMDPNAADAQVKMQLPGPERDAPFGVFASTPDLFGQYVQNQYFDFLYGHQIDNKGVSAQGFSNK
jgi:penicillin amidase